MRITIVMGFFLPVPPLAGGATEKTWHRLAGEFAARGHDVTVISRLWPGLPPQETRDGVRHVRVRGFAHTPSLPCNLWRDLQWSLRVARALPAADVTVANCVALPLLLGLRRGRAGRLAVLPGRMPKGQFRVYRGVDRVLAVSTAVRDAVVAENRALAARIRICGNPIDWSGLAASPRTPASGAPVTVGFVGRLHREKGLEWLAGAARRLALQSDLPPWRLVLCGPVDVAHGGSGPDFAAGLAQSLGAALGAARFQLLEPEYDPDRLATVYRQMDIFCYPSLAVRGETFGVAVAEAMAAGAVPVVSALSCFDDFVHPGETGVVVDHAASNADARLADALAALIRFPARRSQLAHAAQVAVQAYDYPRFAERLLEDFSSLLPAAERQT